MTYTVKPGDSLYKIAQQFGVSVEAIKRANQLTSNDLYIGQRLVIPGTDSKVIVYTVKPGDSLYTIARRFDTTVEGIMVLNSLTSTSLTVGQRLVIPQYMEVIVQVDVANVRQGPGTRFPVMASMDRGARLPVIGSNNDWYKVGLFDGSEGWIFKDTVSFRAYGGDQPIVKIVGYYTLSEGPALPSSYESFVNHTADISDLQLFMFRISRANPTEVEKFGQFTDEEVNRLVEIAHRHNIKILPIIHNLLYEPGNTTISKDVVKVLVTSPQNRAAFIQNVIGLIEKFNFDGAAIDIEDVYMENSEGVSALYRELGAALKAKGYYLAAAVPSRTSDRPTNPFSAPFNYSVIGRAVDQFDVMLYNEHGWPGSGPGPVVSIGWMEKVLRYAMTKMPKEKLVAAVSVFGFDFNLTTGRNTYATYAMAVDLAKKYNKEIVFDQPTKTPMFSYVAENGNRHEVWFEDSRSLLAKIELAWNLGISGVALWRLGMEDPAVWPMLSTQVVVRK